MKKYFVFTLTIAAMLAVVSGLTCVLLKSIYWDWLKIPIGLGGGLFIFRATPYTFILAIPYAIGTKIILCRNGIAKEKQRILIGFIVGALIVIITIAFVFPCDVQPYFVGGYLLKNLFGKQ